MGASVDWYPKREPYRTCQFWGRQMPGPGRIVRYCMRNQWQTMALSNPSNKKYCKVKSCHNYAQFFVWNDSETYRFAHIDRLNLFHSKLAINKECSMKSPETILYRVNKFFYPDNKKPLSVVGSTLNVFSASEEQTAVKTPVFVPRNDWGWIPASRIASYATSISIRPCKQKWFTKVEEHKSKRNARRN